MQKADCIENYLINKPLINGRMILSETKCMRVFVITAKRNYVALY